MNNLIWISFTNSSALLGKGPERLPRSELHWVPGFPDLFTFLKKLLSPHRTRPELDFLFHFWLLPSYSCSRYSPPFPCILLCGSLSWLLCLTETLGGNERCGRKNNGHNDNNKPTGAGFSWTQPSLSIFKIYWVSHTGLERDMRQPRVDLASALQGGPESSSSSAPCWWDPPLR